jgi:hypothetical protein
VVFLNGHREGRVYVVGVNFGMRVSDIPRPPGADDLYGGHDDRLARGNTTVVGSD